MTPDALVSVVIPVHNGERFIRDALTSVLRQTYSPIECIVVNDGSTDGTARILTSFDSVKQIETDQRGAPAARNVGIEASSGRYIAFLDADDLWLPRKTELQVALAQKRPELGLIYTGMHVVNENLDFVARIDPPSGDVALRRTLLLERPVMSLTQTGLVPATVLEEMGGFDERLRVNDDQDLGCRIAIKYPIEAVPRPLTLYRLHAGQLHRNPELVERDNLRVFRKLFDDPDLPEELRGMSRAARANLQISLAGTYRFQRKHLRFLVHAIKACLISPRRVVAAVARLASVTHPLKH